VGKILVVVKPDHVAADHKSATGQNLRPLLQSAHQLEHAKAGETPDLIRGAASKTKKPRRKRSSDEDQPDLIAAK
jgi:hypothetical protein